MDVFLIFDFELSNKKFSKQYFEIRFIKLPFLLKESEKMS